MSNTRKDKSAFCCAPGLISRRFPPDFSHAYACASRVSVRVRVFRSKMKTVHQPEKMIADSCC